MADGCLKLRQCFTGLDALVPRVIKLGVTSTSTVSEPRTTATAATNFPRFRDDAAFGAYGTDGRRCDNWCVCEYWSKRKDENTETVTVCSARGIYLHGISLVLTFARLGALKPPVISVSVGGTSTILIPSTARSTTTDPA